MNTTPIVVASQVFDDGCESIPRASASFVDISDSGDAIEDDQHSCKKENDVLFNVTRAGIGAAVVGGIVGTIVLGPVAGVILAGGAAYATTRKGEIGDASRRVGSKSYKTMLKTRKLVEKKIAKLKTSTQS